ncbi:MAG: hypothetical protein ACXWQQ_12250 [Pseudobdellovibrio sp.]
MKKLILAATLLVATHSFASTISCEGFSNLDQSEGGTKGMSFTAELTQSQIIVKGDFEGTYPRSKPVVYKGKSTTPDVKGKDGILYLSFDVTDGSDGCDSVLVGEPLFNDQRGVVKFRCRGEGFSDSKFDCKIQK